MNNNIDKLLDSLAKSKFRGSFHLNKKMKDYALDKGYIKIKSDAKDLITKRLADAEPKNDGKQTPMKGHPVFIAQHATATCCRGCISKWHHFSKGVALTESQQNYIVGLIMEWIKRQLA